ncbi:trypsin-like peptidase domain-containing protein [Nonomuraea fuscirosea]|uniref:nSTAND1 domain-containing NTPase n=1 Tax=Nonomuraea fuscirosea TaxID=1291556 RepID=UPI002DDA7865|nr:trypsin-like peptidase domain-containing protein [Nonomuraea fuscirosea]WSA51985.1 trypsin-like peptidase domain-containing protein [Nonomuraea fuscirosea]
MAQVLSDGGVVCGAGFLVSSDELVTCAHVVAQAGHGPGSRVSLAFPGLGEDANTVGVVLSEGWREPDAEDIAYLRLVDVPAGARALSLSTATGCRDHAVRSFGYPAQAPPGGHFGYAKVGDLLSGQGWLQLTEANSLTQGFSGAPVADESTGLVIGMMTAITQPDGFVRGLSVAYATTADVLRSVRPVVFAAPENPFRGLEVFSAEHESLFRGRDAAVEAVLNRLRGPRRLLLLLGPSGAGKSSLVQAGVLPALARGALPGSDRWRQELVTRSGQELPAVPGRGEDHLLLVVDQFEEFLIDREAIDRITELVGSRAAVSVILIMRNDFFPQLAAEAPDLLELAADGQVNVPTTLGRSDLKAIIERSGVAFDRDLIERIIADVMEGGSAPITALAPLELALTQLWERRQDGRLTHRDYEAIGRVTGSLATWCTTALSHLSDQQFAVARTILTALVRPPEPERSIPATRQRHPIGRLRELAGPGADEVLRSLARDRVITTYSASSQPDADDRVVELAHDTLTRDWGELREWVRQDSKFHTWLNRVLAAEALWSPNHSPGDLLHGTDLAEGLAWQKDRVLSSGVNAFVNASRRNQQSAVRQARRINLILACALVVALAAGGIAVWQQQVAAGGERQAQSGQLAAVAGNLIDSEPDTAALLAVRAYQTYPDARSLAMLRTAGGLPLHRRFVAAGPVTAVAFSRDGQIVAAGAGRSVQLWDVQTGAGRSRRDLGGDVTAIALSPDGGTLAAGAGKTVSAWGEATVDEQVNSMEFSPDGNLLAIATNRSTWLWRKGDTKPDPLPGQGLAWSLSFSPDGQTLAIVDSTDKIRLRNLATGQTNILSRTGLIFKAVRFGPTNDTLATVNDDDSIRLWQVGSRQDRLIADDATGADRIDALAYSPDGRTLAVGDGDFGSSIWLLDTATGGVRAIVTGHANAITSLVFSSDGRTFASGSTDGTVRVWDTTIGRPLPGSAPGGQPQEQLTARSPDGRTLAVTDSKELWLRDKETGRQRLIRHDLTTITSLAFSQDGRTLSAGGVGGDIRLWDVASGAQRSGGPRFTKREIPGLAFVGDVLIALDVTGLVWSWNRVTGQTSRFHVTATQCENEPGDGPAVAEAAFDPLGRTLAFADNCGAMRLWDVTSARHLITFAGRQDNTAFMLNGRRTLVFSPDGTTLNRGNLTWDISLLARLADPAFAIKRICAAVRRDLTETERDSYLIGQDATPTCPGA